MQRIIFLSVLVALAQGTGACSGDGGDAAPEDCDFDSTFAAIQKTVFEDGGCAVDACHGESLSGGLDLRADASYASLVRVASAVDSSINRVFPGDQDLSLLYRKLAQTTQELSVDGLGQEMPLGGTRLNDDQLAAIAAWIRGGAPETGIVDKTLDNLGCEGDFVASPNKIVPLPAPAIDEGVQFYAGGWDVDAESEDEVCYATYYDFTSTVPAEYQVDCPEFGEGRRCFAFGRNELAQDAASHHSIITVYTRDVDPNGPDWGPWACLGGDNAGTACDPANPGVCGDRSACTTPVKTSVACVGYDGAPNDFSLGASLGGLDDAGVQIQLSGAQESTFIDTPPEGVYSRLPLTGFVAWNSHGFNLTSQATTIEQWVNLTFVPESGRTWLRRQIFEAGDIFAMNTVAPFTKREVCTTFTLPQYSQLTSLSSHMHKRGELFRIWLPPQEPCEDSGSCRVPTTDSDYTSRLYDDPVYTYYDPPLGYNSAAENDRTFKACAVYDNGADDPFEVKRNSESPNTPVCSFVLAQCGCDASERYCLGGDIQGEPCGGDDAVCGEGGLCDACDVYGGVTTDDEMFIPLGSYFVQPPSP